MRRRPFPLAVPVFISLLVNPLAAMAQPPSFTARYDVAANHAPRAIAAADLNGDGYQDLVLGGTNPGTVTILLSHGREDGDGGERFKPPTTIGVGGGPFDLAVGDLNRDGTLD